MSKAGITSVLAFISIAAVICIAGCGGGSGTSSTTSATPNTAPVVAEQGVEATGQLAATRSIAGSRAAQIGNGSFLNPNYAHAFLAPSTYIVAMSKMELLKGTSDTTPYVVFDTANVANPKVISMTSSSSAQSLGENTEYPVAGSYTHVRVTLIYTELVFPCDINDNLGYVDHHFRVYSSTVGAIQHGDVLMLWNNEFCWIKHGEYWPVSGQRPGAEVEGTLVQQTSYVNDNCADPYLVVAPLASPLVVPSNPSGKYTVKVSFDVNSSPEIPGSTGILAWDDVTPDGQFKPAVLKSLGGDNNQEEANEKGGANWSPLCPGITFTYTQE